MPKSSPETIRQGTIHWAFFDPSLGHEIKKRRPAIILSNDLSNAALGTVLLVPLTRVLKPYPSRVNIDIGGVANSAMLEQLRCVDKQRLCGYIGTVSTETLAHITDVLVSYVAR